MNHAACDHTTDTHAYPRLCDAFGHPLGVFDTYATLPPCRACRAILAAEITSERYGWRSTLRHRCGAIGGVIVSRHSRPRREPELLPYLAMYSREPDGPWYTIGRRETRALAEAAVLASHDCPE